MADRDRFVARVVVTAISPESRLAFGCDGARVDKGRNVWSDDSFPPRSGLVQFCFCDTSAKRGLTTRFFADRSDYVAGANARDGGAKKLVAAGG